MSLNEVSLAALCHRLVNALNEWDGITKKEERNRGARAVLDWTIALCQYIRDKGEALGEEPSEEEFASLVCRVASFTMDGFRPSLSIQDFLHSWNNKYLPRKYVPLFDNLAHYARRKNYSILFPKELVSRIMCGEFDGTKFLNLLLNHFLRYPEDVQHLENMKNSDQVAEKDPCYPQMLIYITQAETIDPGQISQLCELVVDRFELSEDREIARKIVHSGAFYTLIKGDEEMNMKSWILYEMGEEHQCGRRCKVFSKILLLVPECADGMRILLENMERVDLNDEQCTFRRALDTIPRSAPPPILCTPPAHKRARVELPASLAFIDCFEYRRMEEELIEMAKRIIRELRRGKINEEDKETEEEFDFEDLYEEEEEEERLTGPWDERRMEMEDRLIDDEDEDEFIDPNDFASFFQ